MLGGIFFVNYLVGGKHCCDEVDDENSFYFGYLRDEYGVFSFFKSVTY